MIRNYGVIFKYYKNETDFIQIHFEVEVTYKGQSQSGNYHFSINRKQVYINESAPDLIIEQLAEKAGLCLYPMEIMTSPEGPFEEIINYEGIKKRWIGKKVELQDYYKGEIAEKIIADLDSIYFYKEKIDRVMKKDLFLTLFFMPIYRKYNNRIATYEKTIDFLAIKKSMLFFIKQEVGNYLTPTKKQIIQLTGNSDGELLSEPELQLDYKIDDETKSIYSVKGILNVHKLKNEVQKIEIQMFQLSEK